MSGMGKALAPQFTSKSQHDERFSPYISRAKRCWTIRFGIHLPRLMPISPSARIYGMVLLAAILPILVPYPPFKN
jgi:hypothetical protein